MNSIDPIDSIEFYILFKNRLIKIIIDKETLNNAVFGFDDFKKIIIKNLNLNINLNLNTGGDFLLSYRNKLLTSNNFRDLLRDNIIIDLNYRLKGGVPMIIPLLYAVFFDPFNGIIDAIVKMTFLVGEIFKLFINLVELSISIFNPSKVIDDVLYASTTGVAQVISAFIYKIDFSQSKADTEGDGGPFAVTDKTRAMCVPPSFINLLILVLCPPLALFLHKGVGGWFIIIICCLLTYYLYYFPGFIFAALHILC